MYDLHTALSRNDSINQRGTVGKGRLTWFLYLSDVLLPIGLFNLRISPRPYGLRESTTSLIYRFNDLWQMSIITPLPGATDNAALIRQPSPRATTLNSFFLLAIFRRVFLRAIPPTIRRTRLPSQNRLLTQEKNANCALLQSDNPHKNYHNRSRRLSAQICAKYQKDDMKNFS